ncbi:cytochrome P450 [Armillaria luteobubalina]|uniref:Cytochrome P450 n=1 Tax=Armillaria luteobubalina TaxID=153913 RepID=A0AA39Q1Q4_9AGAR|nr:cytochrome P450 [Armillaria luteobubalina]
MSSWPTNTLHWSPSPGVLFASILLIFALVKSVSSRLSRRSLPPGPPGIPFLGNVKQLSNSLWVTFRSLQSTYGPLIYISVFGKNIIVINTHEVASDLLDKRARIYSDRPDAYVGSDVLCGGLVMVLARVGDKWRKMRRAAAEGLSKKTAQELQPVQIREALMLVDAIISKPDDWSDLFRESAALLVYTLTYGPSAGRSNAFAALPQINQFVQRLVTATYPGAHLVDFFPWMKHLPSFMTPWRREAEFYFGQDSKMFQSLYKNVESLIAEGDSQSSFAGTLVTEHSKNYDLSRLESSWLSGTMYAAGTETTSGTLTWFVLAMTIYTDVQKRAHEEIDAVVGRDRLPTFSDVDRLPFIQAIIRETLRWNPVSPISSPHRTMEVSASTDHYHGWYIPKDTIVLPNVWAMNRDKSVYGPDADEFNPSRHLDASGANLRTFPNTKGEGTRKLGLCIGRFVAKDSLFINIALILWSFNINSTAEKPPKDEFVNTGLIVRPAHFECTFEPRFPDVPSLIKGQL